MKRNASFMPAIRRIATERLNHAVEVLRDNARATLDRAGGGGELRSGATRRASAPGEPPVSQSGELAASMRAYQTIDRGGELVAAAGSDQMKLVFIERGTASMAPRPLLLPTLLDSQDEVMAIMSGRRVRVQEEGGGG